MYLFQFVMVIPARYDNLRRTSKWEIILFVWLISLQSPLISRWMCFSNLSNYVRNKQQATPPPESLRTRKTFITICFQLIVFNSNSVGELLSTNRLHRGCGVSVLGDFQKLVGHSPGQPAPALESALLWTRASTAWPWDLLPKLNLSLSPLINSC